MQATLKLARAQHVEERTGNPLVKGSRAYDGPGYDHFIYSGEPEPSLSANDAAWARQFVPARV